MSFDKLAGIYVYCMDYHTGQNSRLYRLLCKIDAHLSDRDINYIRDGTYSLWPKAHKVYKYLVERNAQ